MVKITKPEDSWQELENLTRHAETLLQKLGLPYHVITLTTGDMSFTAAMTHDLGSMDSSAKQVPRNFKLLEHH